MVAGASPVPPYHPDYGKQVNAPYDEETDSSDGEAVASDKVHVRQGSEGYEVRLQEREEMLQRYLEDLGEKPGRYIRYMPQPDNDFEEDSDDNLPLACVAGRSAVDVHMQAQ